MKQTGNKVKVAVLNLDQYRSVISKYISTRSMYESYSTSFEKAGLAVRVFSLGAISGLRSLEMDMNLYKRNKEKYQQETRNKVDQIFKQGQKSLRSFQVYLIELNRKTNIYLRAMSEIRNEILNHNRGQAELAGDIGRIYVGVKTSADITMSILSTSTNPVASGIGHLYTTGTTIVSTLADAENADVWTFKGSLTSPVTLIWGGVVGHATGISATRGTLLRGAGAIPGVLYAVNDGMKQWKSFNH